MFSATLLAQVSYFPPPGQVWKEKNPSDLDVNPDKLADAVKFAMENEYTGSRDLRVSILQGFAREPYHHLAGPTKKRGGPAGIILKNGYIIAKWGDIDRVDMTFSVTKSYLSTVAGVALDEGIINNVHDPAKNYVWDGTFEGEHNSKITWHHLLNQSSDWSGQLFGMLDWSDRPPRQGGVDDWKYRELHEPGTHYKYNDVRVNVLSYALLQVWRKPLPKVLKEKIMDPIGASSTWRWYGYDSSWVDVDGIKVQSVSGGGHSGGGIFISARDHARFGLLFMNNGNWNGKQIISENWVNQVQNPSESNEAYGYMWWLFKGEKRNKDISESVFYASGFGGNYIVVDQENELVIVTRWLNPPVMTEMVKHVMEAVDDKL
jgi:CubicO group peptidase (beta-lactamase class C family)